MSRKYRRHSSKNDTSPAFVVVLLIAGFLAVLSQQQDQLTVMLAIVIALLLISGAFYVIRVLRYGQKLRQANLPRIDAMSGEEFELYLKLLLEQKGYAGVKLTERYDLGVDIIAHKDGVTWGIQVKRYSKLVRAEAVRQVVTALNGYKCERAMVITNNYFSRPAKELAASNSCALIDRDALIELIAEVARQPLPEV